MHYENALEERQMSNKPTLESQTYMQLRTAATQRFGELQQLRAQGVAAANAGTVEPEALRRVEAAQATLEHQLKLLTTLQQRYVNSVRISRDRDR